MTRARYTQVSQDSTSYYHCICCCVRWASHLSIPIYPRPLQSRVQV